MLYPGNGDPPQYLQYTVCNSDAAQFNQQLYVTLGDDMSIIPGNGSWNSPSGHSYVQAVLMRNSGCEEVLVHVDKGYGVTVDLKITYYCRNACDQPQYTTSPVVFPVPEQPNNCPGIVIMNDTDIISQNDNNTWCLPAASRRSPAISVDIMAILAFAVVTASVN